MRYVCRVCSRSRRWELQNTSVYEDHDDTLRSKPTSWWKYYQSSNERELPLDALG